MSQLGRYPDYYYVDTTKFNAPCYLKAHPDVAADPIYGPNPALHYMQAGVNVGYDPAPCDATTSQNPVDTDGGPASPGTPIVPPGGSATGTAMNFIEQNPLLVALAIGAILYFATKKKRSF